MPVRVDILEEPGYKVDHNNIYRAVEKVVESRGMGGEVEVSVVIIGEVKMAQLNRKYRKINKATDVLSWPLEEGQAIDGVVRLGDIAVCYEVAGNQAKEKGITIDEEIYALVEHGCWHLAGVHHEGD